MIFGKRITGFTNKGGKEEGALDIIKSWNTVDRALGLLLLVLVPLVRRAHTFLLPSTLTEARIKLTRTMGFIYVDRLLNRDR